MKLQKCIATFMVVCSILAVSCAISCILVGCTSTTATPATATTAAPATATTATPATATTAVPATATTAAPVTATTAAPATAVTATTAAPASETATTVVTTETDGTIVAVKRYPNITIKIVLHERTLKVIFGEEGEYLERELDEKDYREAYKRLHDEARLDAWFEEIHKIR